MQLRTYRVNINQKQPSRCHVHPSTFVVTEFVDDQPWDYCPLCHTPAELIFESRVSKDYTDVDLCPKDPS